MPLYAYRCTQCGHHFEKIQSFSAEPEKACPKCGGVLERPLTAPALQFKGSGWYINDYAAKPASGGGDNKPGTEKPAEGAAPAASSSETKAESKPAASTESTAKPAAPSSTQS